jgi:gliding motility-associated-like protein
VGTIVHYEYSQDNGASWQVLSGTGGQLSINYQDLPTTTQYRALVKNGICDGAYSNTVTVTVLPAVTIAQAGTDQTLCNVTNAQLSGNSPVSGAGVWTMVSGPSAVTIANVGDAGTMVSGLVAGSYVFRWTITNAACSASSDEVTIKVDAAPNPGTLAGSATVCATSNTGTVTLSGQLGNVVRWERSSDQGNTWDPIAQTATQFTYTNLQTTTLYRVVVANGICAAQAGLPVEIKVDAPSAAGTLTGNAVVCADANQGQLALTAYTGSITHWEYSLNAGASWQQLSVSSANYVFNTLTQTTSYRVWVQNGTCAAEASSAVTVEVNPVTIPGTIGGGATVCASGNNGTLLLAGERGRVIQWEYTQDHGVSWHIITNTQSSLNYQQLSTTTGYRVLVQNGVCAPAYTPVVEVVVNEASIGGQLAGTQTVCSGINNGTISLSGHRGSIIGWEYSVDAGVNWLPVVHQTSQLNYQNLVQETWYRALVQNGVCAVAYSDIATISIDQPTQAGTIAGSVTVCASGNSGLLNLQGQQGTVLSWEYSVNAGQNWQIIAGHTATTYSFNNLTVSTQYRVTVKSGTCAAANSTATTVQVIPVIQQILPGTDYTLCTGQELIIPASPATGGNGAYLYQWEWLNSAQQWEPIPAATQSILRLVPTASMRIRRVVTSGICTSIGATIEVTVQSPIANNIISAPAEVCMNGTITIQGSLPTGGDGVYSYTWEQSVDQGTTWTTIQNAQAKDLTVTGVTRDLQIRRVVTTALCSGLQASTSAAFNITVREHAIAAITVAQAVACAPFELKNDNIKATAFPANNSMYEWLVNGNSIGTGILFPGYRMGIGERQAVITLNVKSLYGCNDASATTTIRAEQPAVPVIGLSDTLGCGPMQVLITNQTPSVNDYQYQWYIDQVLVSSAKEPGLSILQRSVTGLDTSYAITVRASSTYCGSFSTNRVVVVRAKPSAAFTALPDTGCSPFTVTFRNESVATSALFNWMLGNGKDTVTQQPVNIQTLYTSNVLKDAKVILYASNACGIDSAATIIRIKPDQIITGLQLSDTALCGEGTIRFLNTTTGAGRTMLDFGDGSAPVHLAEGASVVHHYTQPGTYQITLKAYNDCSEKVLVRLVQVYPAVKARFITNQPDYCLGDSIRMINQSLFATSYQWTFGSSRSVVSLKDPVFIGAIAGLQPVQLIASQAYVNGFTCADTMAAQVLIVPERAGHLYTVDTLGICLPFQVQVINKSLPAVNVLWNWGNGQSSQGDTASQVYSANGRYAVRMTATNAGGCIFRDTVEVVVNAPKGTVSIHASTICIEDQAKLRVNLQDDFPSVTDSIRWFMGDGTVLVTSDKQLVYQYKAAGIYKPRVELIKANGCIIPLQLTDSIRVDQIVAKFGLTANFECGKSVYQFTDSSTAYSGIRAWRWSTPGRDINQLRTHTLSFREGGKQETSLTVESNTGCTASSRATFDVQVFQYPEATITAMAEACRSELLELRSAVKSIDSVALRIWKISNGINTADSIVNTAFLTEGKYSVKLVVATVNQCFDSVYKEIAIHPLPKINVPAQQIVCRGEEITLKADGALRYTWKDAANKIVCDNCTEFTIKPVLTSSYEVIGYNQYGCTEVKQTSIRVINPLRMLTSVADTLCAGESTVLRATGAASYSWLPANGLTGSQSASSVSVRPAETTTYKVIGKDAYNCFTDTASIRVVVGRPTSINLGRDTVIMSGAPYQLRVASATNDIRSWRWSGSPAILCPTCPEPQVKLSNDACITCTVINQYGCVSSDTVCIKTFCPATQVFVPNAFTPDGDGVNDKLVVQGTGIRLIKSFRVFNRWGETVFEKTNFSPGDPAYGWDGKVRGKDASPDVYVYVCEVICEKGLPSIFKGNTAIIK